jgi:iron-sulfur cluster insertion protein
MITLTPAASTKIYDILCEEKDRPEGLRIFVQGGGCSGFTYGFVLEYEHADDDFVIETDAVKVFVDPISAQYLTGASVDYKETLMDSKFVIDNPGAVASCGCGSSFSYNFDIVDEQAGL